MSVSDSLQSDRLARARAVLQAAETRGNMRVASGGTFEKEFSDSRTYGVYHLPPTIEDMLVAVASVMNAEKWVAVAGVFDVGWDAALKMGVNTRRVAVVPNLKDDPAKVVGILVEGFEIVALGDVGIAAAHQRALAARAIGLRKTIFTLNPWQTVSKPWVGTGFGKPPGFEVVTGSLAI